MKTTSLSLMEEQSETVSPPSPSDLRYRNLIAATSLPYYTPSYLRLPTSTSINDAGAASPKMDLELLTSYTSLRDLLHSPSFKSPVSASSGGGAAVYTSAAGPEITIRNRLVKQAAWAYLQPMSSFPGSSGPTNFLRRLWLCLCDRNPISALLRFIKDQVVPGLTRLVDRILRILRVPAST